MKRVISVLLLFTVLFIVGCSSEENSEVEASTEEETVVAEETEDSTDKTEDEAQTSTVEKENNDEADDSNEKYDPNAFVAFEGVDFDGNPVTNDIFKENQLTLVNVWGTNCGPCLEEIPYLQEINDELADEGFQIIGFLTGGEEYKEDAIELMGLLEADYTNLIVPREVFQKLGIQYIPTSFLVDSEGNVVEKRIVGALSKEEYLEKINKYLK